MVDTKAIEVEIPVVPGLPEEFLKVLDSRFGGRKTVVVGVKESNLPAGYREADLSREANRVLGGFFGRWRSREKGRLLNELAGSNMPATEDQLRSVEYDPKTGEEKRVYDARLATEPRRRYDAEAIRRSISGGIPWEDPDLASNDALNARLEQLEHMGEMRAGAVSREMAPYIEGLKRSAEAYRGAREKRVSLAVDSFRPSPQPPAKGQRYGRRRPRDIEALGEAAVRTGMLERDVEKSELTAAGLSPSWMTPDIDPSKVEDARQEALSRIVKRLRKPHEDILEEDIMAVMRGHFGVEELEEAGVDLPFWARRAMRSAVGEVAPIYEGVQAFDKEMDETLGVASEAVQRVMPKIMAAERDIPFDSFRRSVNLLGPIITKLPFTEEGRKEAIKRLEQYDAKMEKAADAQGRAAIARQRGVPERLVTGSEEAQLMSDLYNQTSEEWMTKYPELIPKDERWRVPKEYESVLVGQAARALAPWSDEGMEGISSPDAVRHRMERFAKEYHPFDAWKRESEAWNAVFVKRAKENPILENALLGVKDMFIGFLELAATPLKELGHAIGAISEDTAEVKALRKDYIDWNRKELGVLRGLFPDEEQAIREVAKERSVKEFGAGFVMQYKRLFTDFDTMFQADPVGTSALLVDVLRGARVAASRLPGEKASRMADSLGKFADKAQAEINRHILVAPAMVKHTHRLGQLYGWMARKTSQLIRKPPQLVQEIERAADTSKSSATSASIFAERYRDELLRESGKDPGSMTPAERAMTTEQMGLYSHKKAWDKASVGIPEGDVRVIAHEMLGQMLKDVSPSLKGAIKNVPLEDAPRVLNDYLGGDTMALLRYANDHQLGHAHRRLTRAGVAEEYGPIGEAPRDITLPAEQRREPIAAVRGVKGVKPGTPIQKVRIVDEGGQKREVDFGGARNSTLYPRAAASIMERTLREADPGSPITKQVTKEGVTKTALEWEIEDIQRKISEGKELPPPVIVFDELSGTMLVPNQYPLSPASVRKTHRGFTKMKGSIGNVALLGALLRTLPDTPIPIVVPERQFGMLRGVDPAFALVGIRDPSTGRLINAKKARKRLNQFNKQLEKAEAKRATLRSAENELRFILDKRRAEGTPAQVKAATKALDRMRARRTAADDAVSDREAKRDALQGKLEGEGTLRQSEQEVMTLARAKELFERAAERVEEFKSRHVDPAQKAFDTLVAATHRERMTGDVSVQNAVKLSRLETELATAEKGLRKLKRESGFDEYASVIKRIETRPVPEAYLQSILTERPKYSRTEMRRMREGIEPKPYYETAQKIRHPLGEGRRGVPSLEARVPPLESKVWRPGDPDFIDTERKTQMARELQTLEQGVLRDAKSLARRASTKFRRTSAGEIYKVLKNAESIAKKRQSIERARLLGPLMARGREWLEGRIDITDASDVPPIVQGKSSAVNAAIDRKDGAAARAARGLRFVDATDEQKLAMGMDTTVDISISTPMSQALDDLAAIERMRTRGFDSLKVAAQLWKRAKTTRNVTFITNIASAYMVRAFADGSVTPKGLLEARGLISDYYARKIKDPEMLRTMADLERLGALSGIAKEILILIGKEGNTIRAKVLTEVLEKRLSGIDPTQMTNAQIQAALAHIPNLSPKRALRAWNQAFETLEKKYQGSDPVFKVESALSTIKEAGRLLDSLAMGRSITLPVSERRRVTITKSPRGLVTNSEFSPREVVLKYAVLGANRKYFDYNTLPFAHQMARVTGIDTLITPMYAFTYNARWFPLFKRGLMREILTGSLDYTTNDPKLRAAQSDTIAKQIIKRQLLMLGSREAAKDPEGWSEIVKAIKQFGVWSDYANVLISGGTDEQNVLGGSGFLINDVDRPYFTLVNQITGNATKSPMVTVSADDMIQGGGGRDAPGLMQTLRAMRLARKEPRGGEAKSLKDIMPVSGIPRHDKARVIRWVSEAMRGDVEKLEDLKGVLESVEDSAPTNTSMLANAVFAITGVSGEPGMKAMDEYVLPLIKAMTGQEAPDKQTWRALFEIITNSAAMAEGISSVVDSGDPADFMRALRVKKESHGDVLRYLSRKMGDWRDKAYSDLDVSKGEIDRLQKEYKILAKQAGVGLGPRAVERKAAELNALKRRSPGATEYDSELERLDDLERLSDELFEKRRVRMIAGAAVSNHQKRILANIEAEFAKHGIVTPRGRPKSGRVRYEDFTPEHTHRPVRIPYQREAP